jgi:hypothetical protein
MNDLVTLERRGKERETTEKIETEGKKKKENKVTRELGRIRVNMKVN